MSSCSRDLSSEVSSLLHGKKKRKRSQGDFDLGELEGKPVPNKYNKPDRFCFPFMYVPSSSASFLENEARNVHTQIHEIAAEECDRNTPIPNIIEIIYEFYETSVRKILDDAGPWSRESIYGWLLTLPLIKQRDRLEKISNTIRILDSQELNDDETGTGPEKPNIEIIKLRLMLVKTEKDLMAGYKALNSTAK